MSTTVFPDQLLANHDGEHCFTTSRIVAEYFGKRHRDVLKAINVLVNTIYDTAYCERNFALTSYAIPGPQGGQRAAPEYRLSRNGFALLAMGFTGAPAIRWKIAFLEAFDALEAELHALRNQEAAALHQLRPHYRAILQAKAQGLSHAQICQITGHRSPGSIGRNLKRMRALGLQIDLAAARVSQLRLQ